MNQDYISTLIAGKKGIRYTHVAGKVEFSKDESIGQVSKSASECRSWCK